MRTRPAGKEFLLRLLHKYAGAAAESKLLCLPQGRPSFSTPTGTPQATAKISKRSRVLESRRGLRQDRHGLCEAGKSRLAASHEPERSESNASCTRSSKFECEHHLSSGQLDRSCVLPNCVERER